MNEYKRNKIIALWAVLTFSLSPLALRAEVVKWAVRPQKGVLQQIGQLYRVTCDGKTGLVDRQGRQVAEIQYDSITPFHGGYALLLTGSGRSQKIEGILDSDNRVHQVAEDVYTTPYRWFSNNLMPVRGAGGWGYLSPDGTLSIPLQFQCAFPFSSGVASVTVDGKTFYVTRDMDYLNVEAGYGNLVWGSTFSEGEAVVYTVQQKGYVIDRKGRKVRPYKQKIEYIRDYVNSADHTIGTPLKRPESSDEVEYDQEYSIFSKNGRYGYKRNGQVVVPAQLEEANPVSDGFAIVRMDGYEGVIRFNDGELVVENTTPKLMLRQGEPEKAAQIRVGVPSALADGQLSLNVKDSAGKDLEVNESVSGQQHLFSFKPIGKKRPRSQEELTVNAVCDGLVLFSGQINIEYVQDPKAVVEDVAVQINGADNIANIVKPTIKPVVAPKSEPNLLKPAVFALEAPRAGSKRANPRNEFFISVPISNSGEVAGSTTVTLFVNDKQVSAKTIKVGPKGRVEARIAVPGVMKERIASVKASLQNGKSAKANVTLIPLY